MQQLLSQDILLKLLLAVPRIAILLVVMEFAPQVLHLVITFSAMTAVVRQIITRQILW